MVPSPVRDDDDLTTTIRLARLHLVSRRVPASLVALAVVAVALRVVLRWTPASGASSVMFPLIMAAAAAAVISATTHSPLGEPERVTGAWLPWLRFGSAVIMAGAACGALALGAVGGHLALGAPALLRDLAGLTGIALITAALLGAGLGWTGPLAYLVVSIYAVQQAWTTPWLWPACPAGDGGAAICAGLVFAAGLAAFTVRGASRRS
jgi:hypothetical protein